MGEIVNRRSPGHVKASGVREGTGYRNLEGATAVGEAHLNGGCGFSKDRTVSASCGLEGRELVKQIPGPCSSTALQFLAGASH